MIYTSYQIAVLEKQQSKLERAFQEERASLWNIIEGQTQLIQSLHTASELYVHI